MALVAGLLAGVAAWLVGETILEAYRGRSHSQDPARGGRRGRPPIRQSPSHERFGTFTALGAILGLSLGLSGGLARRSASAGAKAALVGCVVGSIAGVSVSLLVLPNFFKST